jgi:hypothetical protein
LSPISVSESGDGDIVIELSGTHDGHGRSFGRIGVAPHPLTDGDADDPFVEREAALEVADGAARLRLSGIEGDAVALRVGERAKGAPTYWILRRRESGVIIEEGPHPAPPAPPASAASAPTASPAASKPAPTPTLRRKVGRVLRKLGLR